MVKQHVAICRHLYSPCGSPNLFHYIYEIHQPALNILMLIISVCNLLLKKIMCNVHMILKLPHEKGKNGRQNTKARWCLFPNMHKSGCQDVVLMCPIIPFGL
jgi:hypothetical protein